jgi:quercetin dioxygenase-like cupin family protein
MSPHRPRKSPAQRRVFVGFALALFAASCASEPRNWEAPPPRAGLPYLPLPEEQDDLLADLTSDDTALPAKGAPVAPALPDAPALAQAIANLVEPRAECKQPRCELARFLPDPKLIAGKDGKPSKTPAALWLQTIAKGSSVVFRKHAGLDVMALVLKGRVEVKGSDPTEVTSASLWQAVRAQGGDLVLSATRDQARVIMVLVARQGALSNQLEKGAAQPAKVNWQKRPGSFDVVDLNEKPDLAWGEGAFRARTAYGGAAEQRQPASLGVLIASREAVIPKNTHDTEWEYILVLSGKGSTSLGAETRAIAAGVTLQIPAGVPHDFKSEAKEPLVAVQVFAPSGPEQRFSDLAAKEAKKKP